MDYIDLQVLATCFRAKITAPGIFGTVATGDDSVHIAAVQEEHIYGFGLWLWVNIYDTRFFCQMIIDNNPRFGCEDEWSTNKTHQAWISAGISTMSLGWLGCSVGRGR